MANVEISMTFDEDTDSSTMSEAKYKARIQAIGNRLNAANNLGEALINLKDEICELFGAERITVYVVDGVKRELVSRIKSGEEIAESGSRGQTHRRVLCLEPEVGEHQRRIRQEGIECDTTLIFSTIAAGIGKPVSEPNKCWHIRSFSKISHGRH